MFHTNIFKSEEYNSIDNWLNSLKNPYVVGYVVVGFAIVITVLERSMPLLPIFSKQNTIDTIPEEPTISHD